MMRLSMLAAAFTGAAWMLALLLGWTGQAAARPMLPRIDNPYCDVPTYLIPNLPEEALSYMDRAGHSMILVSQAVLSTRPAYGQFLMAHECCHHLLGHVREFHQKLGHVGPQPFFYIKPRLRQMELAADCCAVKLLTKAHQEQSIIAGEKVMAGFGDKPTGAYYPTGQERVKNLEVCAVQAAEGDVAIKAESTGTPQVGAAAAAPQPAMLGPAEGTPKAEAPGSAPATQP